MPTRALWSIKIWCTCRCPRSTWAPVGISISVSPSSINLYGGQTKQFTATVAGTVNQQVQWSMVVGTGTIANGLYTAPSTVTSNALVSISATSMADPTKTASATIMLVPGAPPSTVSISLTPQAPSLTAGQSKQFTATVSGTTNTGVTWSLNPAVGTVVNGLYTAPATVASATKVKIVATSTADTTKTASSTISIAASPAAPAPSVSPVTVSVAPGGTTQFSVLNLPSGATVAWSVSPATGSIAANGLYTAPGTVASQTTVTVTAKDSSTQAVFGTATLTLQATPLPTSLSPTTATVAPAATKQFSVLNLPSGATVAWSVSPATGSIAANGLYTAPGTVASQTTVTVTAKDSSTQAVFGTATLTLQATPLPTSLSPTTATVAPAATKQFSVLNLPSGATVAWSVSPATGSIAANGLYTAPGTVASQTTVTVTAKDSSTQAVFGTATLTLQATPLPTSLSPTTATVAPAATKQFSVLNLPSGATVAWSVSPATGSIAANGLYTAPGTVASQTNVTVTAKDSSTQAVFGTATLTLQATPLPTSLSPTTATVAPAATKQFSVLNLPSGATVAWSVSPATGSIAANGLYTAPGTVASQTTVTVTAKDSSTQAVFGTATLTLQATPLPTSLSPTTATVAPAATKQFSVLNLPSGATATWSVSPATGSIAQSGLYTAPGTVASQTTVTVTAKDSSTQAVFGTATLTLQATPLPTSLSPTTATVAPAATKQFSVLNLPSGATATWSVSPATGSIAQSGLYTAPGTVASQTTVTVTAKNSSTQAVFGTATLTVQASPVISPSVSPSTVTVAPSGTTQFTVQNLPSGTTVSWSVSPSTGSISQGGLYTAPSTVAAQTILVLTAKNSSTQSVLGTSTLTLQASPAAPGATTMTLPVEVVGPDGTTASATFTIPQGTNVGGPLQLWMQIHNLKYETEASVQVNNSGWLPINTANVTLLANGAAFGGIGGGFHTLKMTMNLPAGTVVTGTNTITFRFNATNRVVSGYRVLAFNVQSSGSNLISSSQFVQDDPNNWQPPSTSASDIATGQSLWRTASLTVPVIGGTQTIKAHCSDCHTQDGRDLKYFNFSNNSIEARSAFHGLTAQQGQQIASYIRSLNVPNPGRPWNPPYQPGPGLDSQPVSNWAAGAGLDAVLASDADELPYLAPGGSTAGWSAASKLNAREIPTSLQLLDWNSWLPVVHPMDAFGSAFTSSSLNTALPAIRNILKPNSPTAYKSALEPIGIWFSDRNTFLAPYTTNALNTGWTDSMAVNVYSVALWEIVKMWELNQEFGLEGMPQVPYGAKADVRGWFSGLAFGTAPNILHLPTTPSIGNGTLIGKNYLSLIWYHTQLVQNDGQGTQSGHDPLDYGYALSFVRAVFTQAQLPGIMELLEFQIKDLQGITLTGTGPQVGALGWHPTNTSPENIMVFYVLPLWSATSPAEQTTLMQAYTQAWFDQASKYTPQQYYQGGWATAAENPATDSWSMTVGGQLWYILPRLRYVGVSNTLLDQISAWAAKVFPQGNWSLLNTASCTPQSGPCVTGI